MARIKKPKKTQDEIWQEVKQDPEKLKYYRFNWAKNAIRRASYRWPGSFNAKKQNYIIVPVTLKSGETKLIERCFCSVCGIIDIKKKFQKDHYIPCVPLSGWDSFDGFIERMLCVEEALIIKCLDCHSEVTQQQNEKRRSIKKEKKDAK